MKICFEIEQQNKQQLDKPWWFRFASTTCKCQTWATQCRWPLGQQEVQECLGGTYQRFITVLLRTNKAFLMPVLATYINIFSARTNGFLAILTVIGKLFVIAGDTSWLSFNSHKFLLWQGLVTEITAEVTRMPILIHGLGVLSNIDKLWKGQNNYLMRLFMSHRVTRK